LLPALVFYGIGLASHPFTKKSLLIISKLLLPDEIILIDDCFIR